MKRSEQRILTTHVGSLPRPPELLEAARALANDGPNEGTTATYLDVLRRSVADVVRQQAQVGIDVASDGEFGKTSWATYILERVSGFKVDHERLQPLVWLGRDRE